MIVDHDRARRRRGVCVDDEAAGRAANGRFLLLERAAAARALSPGREVARSWHRIEPISTYEDQPAPSREEQDAPLERREEEDAQRYPAHDDPERVIDPDEVDTG